MIEKTLRLLLPGKIYFWIYWTDMQGNHIGWQDAEELYKTWDEYLLRPRSFDRIAAWAIVISMSYVAAHVICAIAQGRLP